MPDAQVAKPVQPMLGVGQGAPGPETQPATHLNIIATEVEIILVLGKSRVLHIVSADGVPEPQVAIEWHSSITLSPTTAKQIGQALSSAASDWEKRNKVTLPLPTMNVSHPPARGKS